jgi:2-methylisocitrate lyase-like PEP mutase family enzyme
MSKPSLRRLIERPSMLVVPGAYDAIGARMIEQAGFQAVYMTGGATAMAHGFPDYGLLDLGEMAANAEIMARSISVPLIADADTGYGNELNVTRTVRLYEQRGVAGLHLEDQVSPKRCGHLEGKEVVSREEFILKIRAAVAARRNPDFIIIARTDARAVLGLDEAIARANESLAAGADAVFVEAVQTIEEAAAVPRRVKGPCMLNIVQGGRTPVSDLAAAEDMGYRIAILPSVLFTAAVAAGDAALQAIYAKRVAPVAGTPIGEVFNRFGGSEWDPIRRGSTKVA